MKNQVQHFLVNNLYNTSTELCRIMNFYGSDKGSGHHNYTTFYHYLMREHKNKKMNVFELGLGTNDLSITSNMSGNGSPCGSLRGWRDYFINSDIFGADIDDKILINENKISTYYCDQTDPTCIQKMWKTIDKKFDIIVEDGLHTFDANRIFFENSIDVLNDGGIFIVEDIDKNFFNNFEEYITAHRHKFKFMDLIKIPNPKNLSDNNLLLVLK